MTSGKSSNAPLPLFLSPPGSDAEFKTRRSSEDKVLAVLIKNNTKSIIFYRSCVNLLKIM